MNIKCLFGFHKWGKWSVVKPIGRYTQRLKKTCEVCGKIVKYDGLVDKCIETGELSPYVSKN